MKASVQIVRVRCQMKTGLESSIEHKPSFWPFSSAKPRGSHRCSKRFFRTERPFSLAAGCSLNPDCAGPIAWTDGRKQPTKQRVEESRRRPNAACRRVRCGSDEVSDTSRSLDSENSASNPDTGSGHSRPETYGAPPWRDKRSLRLGHARTSQLTGQQEQENVRALHVVSSAESAWTNHLGKRHSEPCGFSFLSSFRSGRWKRVAGPRVCSIFSLGGFLCFPSFLDSFCFTLSPPCAGTVPVHYKLVQVPISTSTNHSVVVNTGTGL